MLIEVFAVDEVKSQISVIAGKPSPIRSPDTGVQKSRREDAVNNVIQRVPQRSMNNYSGCRDSLEECI